MNRSYRIPKVHGVVWILFLVGYFWTLIGAVFNFPAETDVTKWETVLLGLALAATLAAYGRRLPAQNVVAAACLILASSWLTGFAALLADVSLSPRAYGDEGMVETIGGVPWPLPLIWVVAILTGRRLAQTILQPWRSTSHYGYWVIGLSGLLSGLWGVGMEPYTAGVRGYWAWELNGREPGWNGASGVVFIGWLGTGLVLQWLTTPWLISKRLGIGSHLDFHSPAIWCLLQGYFAVGCAQAGRWSVASRTLSACVLILLCVFGASRLAARQPAVRH